MNKGLPAFEAALASLSPAASAIDRDRLMYLAGQAVGAQSPRRHSAWLWPSATAASVLLAVTLAGMLLTRGPRVVEKTVYIPAKPPAEAEAPPIVQPEQAPVAAGHEKPQLAKDATVGDETPARPEKIDRTPKRKKKPRGDYLQLRRMVVARGVDALPKLKPRQPASGAEIPKWSPGPRTDLEPSFGS